MKPPNMKVTDDPIGTETQGVDYSEECSEITTSPKTLIASAIVHANKY